MTQRNDSQSRDGLEERISVREHILLWLLQHPYQRLEDIAPAVGQCPGSVHRHVAVLSVSGQVEHVRPTLGMTDPRYFYYLTTAGIYAAANLLGAEALPLAKRWHADERSLLHLLPRLHTQAHLQDLINSLVQNAPAALASEGVIPQIRWHWIRDYQQTVASKGKIIRCRSDAVLLLACSSSEKTALLQACQTENYYSALLFVDTGVAGNEDVSLIKTRLEQLLKFRESAERWAYYSQFPPALILASSKRNRELWQRCAQEAALHLRLAPLNGAIIVSSEEIKQTSAWRLSWQRLSDGASCRIRDLLPTTAREALLPGLLATHPLLPQIVTGGKPVRVSIVKGRFEQRARQGISHSSESIEREREAVSLLALLAHRRHLEILQQIYAHPFLSKQELAIILDLGAASLTRYLYDLKQMGCVQEEPTECGPRFLLCDRGLRLIAAILNVSLLHVRDIRPGKEGQQKGIASLCRTIKHTAGIYRFVTMLQQAARHHQHHLVWWETGARCARRYRYQGAWHNLLPDATLAYRAGEQTVHAWLEWDEGTMKRRDLEAKLRAYAHYIRARQWMKEHPVLPILVIVVPEKGQELRMQQVVMDLLGETKLVVCSTTASRLQERGPLGKIWWHSGLPSSRTGDEQFPDRQTWLDLRRP